MAAVGFIGRCCRVVTVLTGLGAVRLLAARWIAVVPHAGWQRVEVVAVAGLAVAGAIRDRG